MALYEKLYSFPGVHTLNPNVKLAISVFCYWPQSISTLELN